MINHSLVCDDLSLLYNAVRITVENGDPAATDWWTLGIWGIASLAPLGKQSPGEVPES